MRSLPLALVARLPSAAGPPGWIVEAVLAGGLEPAFDEAIRQEYEEVLRRPEFGVPADRVDELLAVLDRLTGAEERRSLGTVAGSIRW